MSDKSEDGVRSSEHGEQAALPLTKPPTPGWGRAAPPLPSEIAPEFPHLEILDELGTGGCGTVYLARQATLDRLVALKILSTELAQDSGFVSRFQREARALATLQHPNIVAVHDAGRAGPYLFLLMEYVDGMNLRTFMRENNPGSSQTLEIVREVCGALQFAHDAGVVHRDIKPENILLSAAGTVKIADFGLAKMLDRGSQESALTRSSQIMGTPQYMAPEQYETPSQIDHRVDLYSLGVVLYELLTGELPLGRFEVPSRKAAVDARLDDIVLRALAKDRLLRYQHAQEIRTDVEALAGLVAQELAEPTPDTGPKVRGPLASLMGAFWGKHVGEPAEASRPGKLPVVGKLRRGRRVRLTSSGEDQEGIIRALREVSRCTRVAAKEAVASPPTLIAIDVGDSEAQWIRARLEAFGGEVQIS